MWQRFCFFQTIGRIWHNMQRLYLYLEGALLLVLVNGNNNTQRAKQNLSCPPGRQPWNKVADFYTNFNARFSIVVDK